MPSKLRLIGGISAAVLAGALAAPAQANILVSYPNFSGACSGPGLTCVGNTTSPGVLRITPAAGSQSGAAYSTTPVTLGGGNTFSTTFQFQFTNAGGIDPADGITFVLTKSPTGLGINGGGLGYQGVANSVAIEFDTYNNGLDSNHVAVDTNGSLQNYAAANPYGVSTCDFYSGNSGLGCMSNGDIWTVAIGYDGTNLNVSVQDGSNAVQHLIANYGIDIGSILGTNNAYVGFTGSTGSGYENQDILNWQFANTTQLANIPEPGSLALLGLGLAGFAVRRRRKA